MRGSAGLRAVVATLLALAACLVLPAAVAAGWTKAVLTDTDSYVSTVAPLAADAAVQRAVTRRIEEAAVEAVESRTGLRLPAAGRELVADAVGRVVRSAVFAKAWRQANRAVHRQAIRVLEGRSHRAGGGPVSIELGTVVTAVLAVLDEQGLLPGGQLPEVQASFPLVGAQDLRRARDAYAVLDAAGLWLPVLWAVLAAGALLLAPSRRAVVGWLGYGSLATLLALFGGLLLARQAAVAQVASPVDVALVGAVWDVVTRSLYELLGGLLVASAGVLLGRMLVRPR